MKHPKYSVHKNEKYLDYIRAQKCCIILCEHKNAVITPHHVWHTRKNDLLSIPLCMPHHVLLHTMPVKNFEEKFNVNLCEEIIYFLLNYGGFNLQ